jgi:hypothetical protein
VNKLLHIDLDAALRASVVLAALGSIVSAWEYKIRLPLFANDGILPWRVLKLHYPLTARGMVGRLSDILFQSRRFRFVVWLRLVSAVSVLALALAGTVSWPLLLILFLSTAAVTPRSGFGLDGAYQMLVIVIGASLLAAVAPRQSVAREACMWFIAIQLILSYVIAGIAKMRSQVWRSGQAIVGILSTNCYGHPGLFGLLRRHEWIGTLLCWSTIGFELLFPLVLFAPDAIVLGLLVSGLCFHISTAVFMGLNGFLMAFSSAYPALIFVLSKLERPGG